MSVAMDGQHHVEGGARPSLDVTGKHDTGLSSRLLLFIYILAERVLRLRNACTIWLPNGPVGYSVQIALDKDEADRSVSPILF